MILYVVITGAPLINGETYPSICSRLYLFTSIVVVLIYMGELSAKTETDVDKLISENVRLTLDLWDFCAEYHVPFIYESSAATYGSLESNLIDDQSPHFLASLRPLNAYGWSKLVTDRILMQRVADAAPVPPQWCGLKFF